MDADASDGERDDDNDEIGRMRRCPGNERDQATRGKSTSLYNYSVVILNRTTALSEAALEMAPRREWSHDSTRMMPVGTGLESRALELGDAIYICKGFALTTRKRGVTETPPINIQDGNKVKVKRTSTKGN